MPFYRGLTRRPVAILLFLLSSPAFGFDQPGASEGPLGLAGRAESIPAGSYILGGTGRYFEWHNYFGEHHLDSSTHLELTFSIIPFNPGRDGPTSVGLDAETGSTFFSLQFKAGLVNGRLPYVPTDWNNIRASLDFASQSYRLKVNDLEAGPFPFNVQSMSAVAFRLNYAAPGREPDVAWIDSVLLRNGETTLLSVDFDSTFPRAQSYCPGCQLAALPPGTKLPDPPPGFRPPARIQGLAGRAETTFSDFGGQYFEWYVSFFEPFLVEEEGQLELSLFIVPFFGSGTSIGLDAANGSTFFGFGFEAGLVNRALPYNPTNWNHVKALLDYKTQSYQLTVNGAEAGPFPFGLPSKSAAAFRVNSSGQGNQPFVAWFDSVQIRSGTTPVLNFDFESGRPSQNTVCRDCLFTVEDLGPTYGPAFDATADSIRPRLQLARTESGLILTWPASQSRYQLQISDSIAGPWNTLSAIYGFDKTNRVLDLGPRPGTKFFRLVTAQ